MKIAMEKNLLWGAFFIYAVGLLGSMATMSIGVSVLSLAILLFSLNKMDWKKWISDSTVQIYFALAISFFSVSAISLLFTKLYPITIHGKILEVIEYSLIFKFWYLFWLPLLGLGLRYLTEEQRGKVIGVWWIVSVFIAVIAIQQFFTGWPKAQEVPDGTQRYHATAFFKHHLSLASILIFPFFWGLDLARWPERRKKLRIPILNLSFCVAGNIILFSALILSFSKILWLTFPLCFFLWGWISLRKKARVLWFCGGILLVVAGISTPDFRLKIIQVVHSDSYIDRNEIWSANWNLFRLRPLFGVGFRQNSELTAPYLIERHPEKKGNVFNGHAHSNILESLVGTGIIGFFFFLLFNGFLFYLLWQGLRNTGNSLVSGGGVFCAFLLLHLNGLTQVNFWEGKVLHTTMWILAWVLFENRDASFKKTAQGIS